MIRDIAEIKAKLDNCRSCAEKGCPLKSSDFVCDNHPRIETELRHDSEDIKEMKEDIKEIKTDIKNIWWKLAIIIGAFGAINIGIPLLG